MPDDLSSVFTRDKLCFWSNHYGELDKYLKWYLRHGVRFGEILSANTIFRELRVNMPRKKGTNNAGINHANGNSGSRKGGNVEWKWHNIKLTDEDAEFLAGSDATLEYLAISACELADNGFGFKVEPTDGGKSIRATIYGSYMDNELILVGVSSYGGTVRDALLAVLYKFDHYLGGDFSSVVLENASDRPTSRFR